MINETTWEFGVSRQLRNGFHNYIILETELDVDTYEFEMIRNNTELNLLFADVNQEVVKYDISDLFSLEESIVQHLSDFLWFEKFMQNTIKTMKDMDNYLLQVDSISLDPRLIFLDDKHERIHLFYIPNYQGNIQKEFCSLIEYFMKKMDHSQKKLVTLIYGLYHVVQDGQYSIWRVQNYLDEYKSEFEIDCNKQNETRENMDDIYDEEDYFHCDETSERILDEDEKDERNEIDGRKGRNGRNGIESFDSKCKKKSNHANEKKKSHLQSIEHLIIATTLLICCCIGSVYCYHSIFQYQSNLEIYWFWFGIIGAIVCLLMDLRIVVDLASKKGLYNG